MDSRYNSLSIKVIIFYAFFAILFGMRMWGIYESKPLYSPLLLVGFALWGLSILMTEHSILEYAVIIAFIGLAGLVYIKTGEKGLLLYFALMLGMKGVSVKGVFKSGLVVGMAGMICLTFLASFGIIEDVSYIQERHFFGDVFRRSLGFPHPNTLSSSFTILAMMIMYLIGHEDKKKLWKTSAVLVIIATYLYFYSGSRTGIMITFGYLMLNLFYAYRGKAGIVEKIVLILLFPILWIFSIVGPALSTDETIAFVRKFDYNVGSRWEVGSYYWKNNGMTLFGCRLANPDAMPYGIDLAQLYLLLQLGVVAFVVVTLLWFLVIHDEVKNQRISELVITFSLLVMGAMDPFLYNIGFKNLAFCFMGVSLYSVLQNALGKLPETFSKQICIFKIGDKAIDSPIFKPRLNDRNKRDARSSFPALFLMLALLVAIIRFVVVPNPDYVLVDRDYGEQKWGRDFGLIGKTYSRDDIKNIESAGNIVLDYTDENEMMYTYYSHDEGSVTGGYYAPNAAMMEKFRYSLSIFFWGCWLVVGVTYMLRHKRL